MVNRYHCDYCNKSMVATPAIVKTHNSGLLHQKAVQEHYQQYKDAETILQEEASKKPCMRFPQGLCQFGAICRFSHYSSEDINSLKEYVTSKNNQHLSKQLLSFEDLYQKLQDEKAKTNNKIEDDTTSVYDSNGVTHVLPWTYNEILEGYGANLPPSIRKINLEDFRDAQIMEWG